VENATEIWASREKPVLIGAHGGEAADSGYASSSFALDLLGFHRTDAGFAEFLAALRGKDLRFDHRLGRWLRWDGVRWREDNDAEILRLTLEIARTAQRAALDIQDEDLRKAFSDWAFSLESVRRRNAGLDWLRALPPIATSGEDIDRDPWLLGVQNGTVDLRTGEFFEGRREDLITCSTGPRFEPGADCPRWKRFLSEVFGGDGALIEFIQRAVGYSLTGATQEQTFFLLWGAGYNGKTVFLNILNALAGDYGRTADFATFLADKHRSGGAATPDLVALAGRRLVTARETDDGARFSSTRIKTFSGGDPISARPLYGRQFEFLPQFKMWLATNNKPVIRDQSEGMWRRVRLIPFTLSFKGREDKGLEGALMEELRGVLSWSIEGCLKWQRDGLDIPAAVREATQSYREENDPLAEFFEERVVFGESCRCRARDLYAAFVEWRGKLPAMSQTAFGRAISERFAGERTVQREKKERSVCYVGVGIRA